MAGCAGEGPWGRGSLFFAHQGFGAYCSPLWQHDGQQAVPPRRVWVHDVQPPFHGARFMEAVEAKHSDHSFTAALVSRMKAWAHACKHWSAATQICEMRITVLLCSVQLLFREDAVQQTSEGKFLASMPLRNPCQYW